MSKRHPGWQQVPPEAHEQQRPHGQAPIPKEGDDA
jgi:hypothetical protein